MWNKTLWSTGDHCGRIVRWHFDVAPCCWLALLIFGILQGALNAGYWLLSINLDSIYSMGAAVFFENLCGGMGTSAFVALLMTLCNKSFSATQFALRFSAFRWLPVYAGSVAGWFVEAHGWSTFYLFSVAAAVPGLFCCWFAARRLNIHE